MVGIGVGILKPEQGYNIRLGNIVVSQFNGISERVIQYDLVKAKKGNQLKNRGFLNMLPEALFKALINLQAEYKLKLSKVPQFLEEIVKRYFKMAESKLGKPGYIH